MTSPVRLKRMQPNGDHRSQLIYGDGALVRVQSHAVRYNFPWHLVWQLLNATARAAHIRSRLGSGPPAQCARNSFSAWAAPSCREIAICHNP